MLKISLFHCANADTQGVSPKGGGGLGAGGIDRWKIAAKNSENRTDLILVTFVVFFTALWTF